MIIQIVPKCNPKCPDEEETEGDLTQQREGSNVTTKAEMEITS